MQINHTIPKASNHFKILQVSKNSNYFTALNSGDPGVRIYHIFNGTLNYITLTSYREINFCFNYSGNKSIFTHNNAIRIYNSNDNTFVNRIYLQDSEDSELRFPNVDPYFEDLIIGQFRIVNVGVTKYYIDVYNMRTGQILKRIKMPLNWDKERLYTYRDKIYIINKTLFSGHGYYMQLDL